MKTAIIIGATGLIGNALLNKLLADSRYSSITVLVRKKLAIEHPKLQQVIVDFNTLDASVFKSNELFCCLGTTIKTAGSKEAFYKVDYEYVVNSAMLAKQNGVVKFAVISSMNADKNSSVLYTKTKGEMEESVSNTGFEACFIFRPSLLLGNRKEFRFGERIATIVMTSLSFLIPVKYKAVKDTEVAKAMIHFMNKNQTGNYIIENDAIIHLNR